MEVYKKDRISSLPKEIKQHILSYLETKEAIATSILSSSWRYDWLNINNLDFFFLWYHYDRRKKFGPYYNSYDSSENYVQRYVELVDELYTKMRNVLHDDHLTCPYIKLYVRSNEDYDPKIASHLSNLKVKNVDLSILFGRNHTISNELFTFILTCESLTRLELNYCVLPSRPLILSSSRCLRTLSLCRVVIHQVVIDEVLANCGAALESLSFRCCEGLYKLKLKGFKRIEKLKLHDNCNLESVEIDDDASNFQCLEFSYDDYRPYSSSDKSACVVFQLPYLKELKLRSQCNMLVMNESPSIALVEKHSKAGASEALKARYVDLLSLNSFQSLTRLELIQCFYVNDDWLNANLSKFVNLKVLEIVSCGELKHINISLQLLRMLSISWCNNLDSIELDCPNLTKFTYTPHTRRSISHIGGRTITSGALTRVEFNYFCSNLKDANFHALLNNIGDCKHLILQNLEIQDVMELMKIRLKRKSPPLYRVRHLKLSIEERCGLRWPPLRVIFDALFVICPHLEQIHLTCTQKFRYCNVMIGLKYKEPTQGNKNNNNCDCDCDCYASSPSPINCWKHSVKDVVIDPKKGFEDDNSLEEFINNTSWCSSIDLDIPYIQLYPALELRRIS